MFFLLKIDLIILLVIVILIVGLIINMILYLFINKNFFLDIWIIIYD